MKNRINRILKIIISKVRREIDRAKEAILRIEHIY